MRGKIFVLDTNVLLHDYHCLSNFEENDIVIPLTVLDELDKFKMGNELINFNAREIGRTLDKLSGKTLFTHGVSLGEGLGKLTIVPGKPFTAEMRLSFETVSPDHQILATALWVQAEHTGETVILVSKDSILRAKAKSLGLQAEDYRSDMVQDVSLVDSESVVLKGVSSSLLTALQEGEGIAPQELALERPPYANQCFVLEGAQEQVMACYRAHINRLMLVEPKRVYGIEPRNSEQIFAVHLLMQSDIPLVSLTGKAGTGKTLLALAAALAQEQNYDCIMLARPIVPLSNKDIGFLPGDIDAKIAPYTRPLFDNLSVIKGGLRSTSREYHRIEEMQNEGKLLITPLAYIRGRSLSNTFIIVDEAQNLTPHEIKTIITRGGDGTRMVFTGDVYQIDQPYLNTRSNGLSYMTEKMLGQPMFGHINLVKGERSALANLANEIL